ncbi:hypothetical protein WJX81_001985 [Elliptochloris bilobata]|uniref:Gamma-interferon-inducible lysosomal thiol reductase n=1 Tax=Elliptochloris bilobata TaxID=381761 RepID=A0AAW1S008_9CHLO
MLLAIAGVTAKVKVDFYGEALCPYCAKFLTETAAPLFAEGFAPYMDFRYVAYGNAKNTSDGLECQHGPEECLENRALLCAIGDATNQTDWFPFALCLSENHTPEAIGLCTHAAKLDGEAIHKCMNGDLGSELVRSAAKETAGLDPPHTYVPWIVVNGVAIEVLVYI